MDKNTITGLILIVVVLIGFSYFSRPDKDQQALQNQYSDSMQIEQQKKALEAEAELRVRQDASLSASHLDSTSIYYNVAKGEEKSYTLENDVATFTLSNKGGVITSAILKKYNGQDAKPVEFYRTKDTSLNFVFFNGKETINTRNLYFTPVNVTPESMTMRMQVDAASYIDFNYSIQPNSYMVDFTIQAVNMEGKLSKSVNSVDIEWSDKVHQIEKGYTFENRYSTLTYHTTGDDTNEVSGTGVEKEDIEEGLDWVACKNQFFSAVLIANQSFQANATLTSTPETKESGYLKKFTANLKTFFDPTGAEKTSMQFYFGPNKYNLLANLDSKLSDGRDLELHQLVPLGWSILRWVNRFFTIPLFDLLSNLGFSMGIVLLLMTVIVKLVVFPFTLKSYMSSAKMRVLKPQIQVINDKYPKKEDAMKKQQETSTLYKKYGVSPLGGCLPMLIQWPIFIALFMFVPTAIELRQQGFLWATDLSTYDDLISWNTDIMFIGNHISLFCLLFSVTNIINSVFMMKQQDTGQAMPGMKIMTYAMPVMFIFILNDYAAGLNYYYLVSTLTSIFIMLGMRHFIKDHEILAKLEANKKDPTQIKQSGLMARMAALQEEQADIAKKKKKK